MIISHFSSHFLFPFHTSSSSFTAETYALSYDHLRTRDPLRVHIMPAKTVSQAFDIMLESPLAELMESHLLSGYHDCLECIRQGIAAGDELPALLLQQVRMIRKIKVNDDKDILR